MKDRLCFVQFLHPGGEHEPDHDDCKHRNFDDHKRKFMKIEGRYRSGPSSEDRRAEIVFWGEWEPESHVIERFGYGLNGLPRFLYQPYYSKPTRNDGQNTDPFVFGEQFLYTECRQHRATGPTQLRYLTHGSVVLFGSRLGPSFVLDTVFVANTYVDHTVANYRPRLNGIVSKTYEMATLNALYRTQRPDLNDHRLYIGATPERSVEGMFSFFPCMSFEQSRDGFQRPQIKLPGYIAEKQAMGYKLTPGLGLGKMRQLWDEVVGQVTNAGLALGVSADLPQAGPACPLAAGPYPADRGSRASCSPAVRRNPRRDC